MVLTKALPLFLLIGLLSDSNQAQTYSPHSIDPQQELNVFDPDNELFKKETIRLKGYKEAFVVNTFGNRDVDGDAEFKDTLYAYKFDTLGRTIQKIIFDKHSSPNTFNLLAPRTQTEYFELRKTLNAGTEVIYSVDTGSGAQDTLFIRTETFDKNGRLKEVSSKPTTGYLRRITCATGTSYHIQYDYDEEGRITFFRNFRYSTYDSISYSKYGYEVRTFEVNSDSLQSEEFILVNRAEDTESVIGNSEQVIKSYECKLLKTISIIDMGYFPSIRYYEIYYR